MKIFRINCSVSAEQAARIADALIYGRVEYEKGTRRYNDRGAGARMEDTPPKAFLKGYTVSGRTVELTGPEGGELEEFRADFGDGSELFALEVVEALLRAGVAEAQVWVPEDQRGSLETGSPLKRGGFGKDHLFVAVSDSYGTDLVLVQRSLDRCANSRMRELGIAGAE